MYLKIILLGKFLDYPLNTYIELLKKIKQHFISKYFGHTNHTHKNGKLNKFVIYD